MAIAFGSSVMDAFRLTCSTAVEAINKKAPDLFGALLAVF